MTVDKEVSTEDYKIKTTLMARIRRRIEDRLRKDNDTVLKVAEILKVKKTE